MPVSFSSSLEVGGSHERLLTMLRACSSTKLWATSIWSTHEGSEGGTHDKLPDIRCSVRGVPRAAGGPPRRKLEAEAMPPEGGADAAGCTGLGMWASVASGGGGGRSAAAAAAAKPSQGVCGASGSGGASTGTVGDAGAGGADGGACGSRDASSARKLGQASICAAQEGSEGGGPQDMLPDIGSPRRVPPPGGRAALHRRPWAPQGGTDIEAPVCPGLGAWAPQGGTDIEAPVCTGLGAWAPGGGGGGGSAAAAAAAKPIHGGCGACGGRVISSATKLGQACGRAAARGDGAERRRGPGCPLGAVMVKEGTDAKPVAMPGCDEGARHGEGTKDRQRS